MRAFRNIAALALALTLNSCDCTAQNAYAPLRESAEQMLTESWQHYKQNKISEKGRPLSDKDSSDVDGDDNRQEAQTVSEASSYVMLRAYHMDDPETFDKTWEWTKENTQRKNIQEVYHWNAHEWKSPEDLGLAKDNLFAWRWLEDIEGSGKDGVIYYTQESSDALWRDGYDDATDASQDMAAALIMAAERWDEPSYAEDAEDILKDIWQKEVKYIDGKPYLLGGDKFGAINGINPSYFRPEHYESIFAETDKSNPWPDLAVTSYEALQGCSEIAGGTTGLPPNWCEIKDGEYTENEWFTNKNGELFGWDAFRTLYWVARDGHTGDDELAQSFIEKTYAFLKRELDKNGFLHAGYTLDGKTTTKDGLDTERPCMNGAYLAYFIESGDVESAKKIFYRLKSDYSSGYWGDDEKEYYCQNWAWLGLEHLLEEAR